MIDFKIGRHLLNPAQLKGPNSHQKKSEVASVLICRGTDWGSSTFLECWLKNTILQHKQSGIYLRAAIQVAVTGDAAMLCIFLCTYKSQPQPFQDSERQFVVNALHSAPVQTQTPTAPH